MLHVIANALTRSCFHIAKTKTRLPFDNRVNCFSYMLYLVWLRRRGYFFPSPILAHHDSLRCDLKSNQLIV